MYSTLVVFFSVTVLALAAKGLLCWAHGGPARGRQKLEIEKRRRLHDGQLSSASCSGRRFTIFDRWRATAGPRISGFCKDAPRMDIYRVLYFKAFQLYTHHTISLIYNAEHPLRLNPPDTCGPGSCASCSRGEVPM